MPDGEGEGRNRYVITVVSYCSAGPDAAVLGVERIIDRPFQVPLALRAAPKAR
jgi:hypothetical protein